MENQVQTQRGEIVEILNGVLVCRHDKKNLDTITDWMHQQDWYDFKCELRVEDTNIFFEMPDTYPTKHILSLLEHFEHQK